MMTETQTTQEPPQMPQSREKSGREPVRRIGTITFGWVLVAAGVIMMLSLFFPKWNFRWALKLSPVILISLGVETLLASRREEKMKYDWVAMLLCFLVVCAALVLFILAWVTLYHPECINW